MRKVELRYITLQDLFITFGLCGLSFFSGFIVQLISIFLLSFFLRFIVNYVFSREDKTEE